MVVVLVDILFPPFLEGHSKMLKGQIFGHSKDETMFKAVEHYCIARCAGTYFILKIFSFFDKFVGHRYFPLGIWQELAQAVMNNNVEKVKELLTQDDHEIRLLLDYPREYVEGIAKKFKKQVKIIHISTYCVFYTIIEAACYILSFRGNTTCSCVIAWISGSIERIVW